MDQHVARLQDMLRCEQAKVSCSLNPFRLIFYTVPVLKEQFKAQDEPSIAWNLTLGHNWTSISACEDGCQSWHNFWVNYPFKSCSCCCQCTRLQLRSHQQEAELKRREQQISRLKERLLDRPREKGPCETHSCRIFPYISNICWNWSPIYSHRGVELPARRPSQTARQSLQVYCEVRWFL